MNKLLKQFKIILFIIIILFIAVLLYFKFNPCIFDNITKLGLNFGKILLIEYLLSSIIVLVGIIVIFLKYRLHINITILTLLLFVCIFNFLDQKSVLYTTTLSFNLEHIINVWYYNSDLQGNCVFIISIILLIRYLIKSNHAKRCYSKVITSYKMILIVIGYISSMILFLQMYGVFIKNTNFIILDKIIFIQFIIIMILSIIGIIYSNYYNNLNFIYGFTILCITNIFNIYFYAKLIFFKGSIYYFIYYKIFYEFLFMYVLMFIILGIIKISKDCIIVRCQQ